MNQTDRAHPHNHFYIEAFKNFTGKQRDNHHHRRDDGGVHSHLLAGKAHVLGDRHDKHPVAVVNNAEGAKHSHKACSYNPPTIENFSVRSSIHFHPTFLVVL